MSDDVRSEQDSVRVRLTADTKAAWKVALDGRKVSQQHAIETLFIWFSRLDPLHQAMILGQVPEAPDVATLLLKRIQANAPEPRYASLVSSTGTPGGKRKGK